MDLRIFRNQAFGEVRVADIGGRPMFAAGDIARALGYANPRDGSVLVTSTTKVTGKGQIYFVNKFLNLQPLKTA